MLYTTYNTITSTRIPAIMVVFGSLRFELARALNIASIATFAVNVKSKKIKNWSAV